MPYALRSLATIIYYNSEADRHLALIIHVYNSTNYDRSILNFLHIEISIDYFFLYFYNPSVVKLKIKPLRRPD